MTVSLKAVDVAKYFLAQNDKDAGDNTSNLKLQKLLYYAQGFHLAMFDSPLFSEEIQAWQHGPVVPEVYRQYKEYGSEGIPCPTDFNQYIFDSKTINFLNDIYEAFGQFSAWKLRNMTHEEPPWIKAQEQESAWDSKVITHESMKEYFKTQIIQ